MRVSIDSGASVRGVASLLRLVFANLVDNAIKFSPKGETVEVVLKRADGMAVFSVRSGGPPIPPEERGRIFQRFHRSETGDGRRGTGLGLAIVKKVCDIHGVSIRLESSEGAGNTFVAEFREG
jgi:two-component system OmpR family sensor kinase